MKNKNGFTIVELIVVITILAILGTIVFLSMQGYSSNARDSTRTSDLSSIKTSLELFITKTGNYPLPSNYEGITYSGGLVWNQGTFGNEPFKQLGDINKLPKDPLTGVEYTYSITNNKTEYELAGVYEGGLSRIKEKEILKETYAEGNLQGTTKIIGTYNGVSLYLSTGSYNFTIFTPSIINSDITDVDVESIITNNKLSINGKNKLPSSYQNSVFKDIPIELGITEIVISTGSLGDLKTNTQSGKLLRKEYITKLQDILSGSTLNINGIYSNISNLDVDSTNSDLIAMSIITGKGVVGNTIASITQNTSSNSCTTQPSYTNATFTEGTPVSQDTEWQNTNNSNPCYYFCTNGYTGNDCSTSPSPYANCISASTTVLPSLTTYSGCDSFDIIICTGSQTGYTISSCNVGTNISGLTSISYGNYFQWGNNGGTSFGNITPNTTRVNVSSYGPGNYYSNTTFIGGGSLPSPYDWANPQNNDLWGNTTNNSIARQGPCATGYHVPTQSEWSGVVSLWGTNGTNLQNALKLPYSGTKEWSDGFMYDDTTNGDYWSSSVTGTYSYRFRFDYNHINPSIASGRATGSSIRCFKN